MQAIEAMGAIDAQGQLHLDQPLQVSHPSRVRVIVLLADSTDALEQTLAEPETDLAGATSENHLSPHTRPIWERVADISAQVPLEEWETLPKDLSKNLDHYLYGSPKESE